MVEVMNLSTGDVQIFSCDARRAVVAAYEQSNDNFNTWEYKHFYNHPEAMEGKNTFNVGDFSALKP